MRTIAFILLWGAVAHAQEPVKAIEPHTARAAAVGLTTTVPGIGALLALIGVPAWKAVKKHARAKQ